MVLTGYIDPCISSFNRFIILFLLSPHLVVIYTTTYILLVVLQDSVVAVPAIGKLRVPISHQILIAKAPTCGSR
ncbi:hypothetical protein VN97_g2034 [Penicillium thymicola]|uniref:Uncharacterized protein n=1 Tax=Penicillium thymicola TaxID=293382 RepID=A0AAI9TQG5_PENTH|nr:hypothetical protein VN97_g2034 [Penicillium thymicola]